MLNHSHDTIEAGGIFVAKTLADIGGFLLDMDGTVYLGKRLLPGAAAFISLLRQNKIKFLFLTNNSAYDRTAYRAKLISLGIEVEEEEILTAGEATAIYLAKKRPRAKVFVLGTSALKGEFSRRQFEVVGRDGEPDYVVLGFDTGLTYQRLWDACDLVRAGTAYIATHPDLNCPLDGGRFMPDAGSISAFIEASTGRRPKVIGKPNREMAEAALKRLQPLKKGVAIVGDRLYTDIAMGAESGITSILLLSGETQAEDVPGSICKPDFIFPSIAELASALAETIEDW